MIYVMTGHLGAGKTLLSVQMALNYLAAGRRVASNMTLFLDEAFPPTSKATAIKLPYIPDAASLKSLGPGYEGKYDEEKFGLILLDEAGTWLNSRDWNDKDRRGLFQWITHARKHGWDVALIVQDYEALDSQIRRSVTEIYVTCSRLDRIKLPGIPVTLPRIHRAKALYKGPTGALYKTWHTRGTSTFKAFDTREEVRPNMMEVGDDLIEIKPVYSLLSAWHLKGRYLPQKKPLMERLWDRAKPVLISLQRPRLPPPPSKLVAHSLPAYRVLKLTGRLSRV